MFYFGTVVGQNLDDEDDLIQTAITDITQLCAENVILWTQFLEAVTLQLELQRYLAKEHHSARVSLLNVKVHFVDWKGQFVERKCPVVNSVIYLSV